MSELIKDVKQWIEQEKVWDGEMFATGVTSPFSGEVGQRPGEGSGRPSINKVPSPQPSPEKGEGGEKVLSIEKVAALTALYEKYKTCTRCQLGFSRIKFVFGVGNPNSEVLFIGEGPGYEEDRRGEPFVGKSGQLLDKMMAAIGLSRQTNAYIANIVKCHPMINPQTPDARSNDRPPSPEEVETCSPILLQQILIMRPKVIMTLGSPSTKMVLKTKDAITGLRGKLFPFPVDLHYPLLPVDPVLQLAPDAREALGKIQVLPTFHPAALLRNPNLKVESWADLKLLRELLGKP